MLEITNLHASVGDKPILKGLTLDVPAGEIHAIMGPNGAGKSTLANVLATPHVGYVSQQNYHQFFSQMIEDIQAWSAGKPIRLLS